MGGEPSRALERDDAVEAGRPCANASDGRARETRRECSAVRCGARCGAVVARSLARSLARSRHHSFILSAAFIVGDARARRESATGREVFERARESSGRLIDARADVAVARRRLERTDGATVRVHDEPIRRD